MNETSGPQPTAASTEKKQFLGADVTVVTVGAGVMFAVVLVIFIWATSDVVRFDSPTPVIGQALTVGGFLLTGSALAVALLIFQFQTQSSQQQHDELIQRLSPEVLEEDMATADSEAHDGDDETDDGEAADGDDVSRERTIATDELIAMGVDPAQAKKYDVFDHGSVPIHVLAGLYSGWKELQKAGELDKNWGTTGWEANEAVAYRLKPGTGKGNHRWFVRLTDRDDPNRTHLWQVSPGGRGRTSPKVKRLSPTQ